MDDRALKDFLYGGIRELVKNKEYYHNSSVGAQYCHWKDQGVQALSDFMNLIAFQMLVNEQNDLNTRAKELVVKGLKGENV